MKPSIGHLFKQIHIKFQRRMNYNLASENLTLTQINLLSFLLDHKSEKITQKDIVEKMEIKHTTVIGLLKRLEEKGLVRTVVDEQNKKYRNILLTPDALKVEKEIYAHRREMDELIVKNLTEEEVKELYRLLEIVRDNIS